MTGATTETATKQERVDFLKQTMAFNEGNVRAYDVKAQISLAAFVLSGNPLMATINGACAVRRQARLGSIEPGKQADFSIYDLSDYREIPYFAAVNFCAATFKRGELVWSADESIN